MNHFDLPLVVVRKQILTGFFTSWLGSKFENFVGH